MLVKFYTTLETVLWTGNWNSTWVDQHFKVTDVVNCMCESHVYVKTTEEIVKKLPDFKYAIPVLKVAPRY